MKLFIFIMILSLPVLLMAGELPDSDWEVQNNPYDFGVINEGEKVFIDFVITNTGSQKLEIFEVKPACGCTLIGSWDKEILPGEKGHIPVVFESRGFHGDIKKSVLLVTKPQNSKEIILEFLGIVLAPVMMSPEEYSFGILESVDKSVTASFIFESRVADPLEILEILPPAKHNVEYHLETIEDYKKYKLVFTINPPFLELEYVRDRFGIKTNNKLRPYYYPHFSYQR